MKEALLVLENGYSEVGEAFAGEGTVFAEFVFNTSMTGYEKIISDPSYKEQAIVFTYPLIGNYGINKNFFESDRVQASAVIIREYNEFYSNYSAKTSLKKVINKENGVIGLTDIDTRELTLNIRNYGTIKGAISTEYSDVATLLKMVKDSPPIEKKNPVKAVVNNEVSYFSGDLSKKHTLLIIDFGIKKSIIETLKKYFRKLILFPYSEDINRRIFEMRFDAVFFSNGPGDPRILQGIDELTKGLVTKKIPIVGICLGHQLVGRAFNLEILKLNFGHHGGNHPVKNLENGKVYITAQNHNYAISRESLEKSKEFLLTWLNLYDYTVEGMKHKELPIYTVQFHPEAAPGPSDAKELVFKEMFEVINACKR